MIPPTFEIWSLCLEAILTIVVFSLFLAEIFVPASRSVVKARSLGCRTSWNSPGKTVNSEKLAPGSSVDSPATSSLFHLVARARCGEVLHRHRISRSWRSIPIGSTFLLRIHERWINPGVQMIGRSFNVLAPRQTVPRLARATIDSHLPA